MSAKGEAIIGIRGDSRCIMLPLAAASEKFAFPDNNPPRENDDIEVLGLFEVLESADVMPLPAAVKGLNSVAKMDLT